MGQHELIHALQLPSYHVTSRGANHVPRLIKRPVDWIRALLLEEVYMSVHAASRQILVLISFHRRADANFNPADDYLVDDSRCLRIGVNAVI